MGHNIVATENSQQENKALFPSIFISFPVTLDVAWIIMKQKVVAGPLKAHIRPGRHSCSCGHRHWQCMSLCLTHFSSLKTFHVRKPCISLHGKNHSVANTASHGWHATKIQTRIWSDMSQIKCMSQAFVTTWFYNYRMFHVVHFNRSKPLWET